MDEVDPAAIIADGVPTLIYSIHWHILNIFPMTVTFDKSHPLKRPLSVTIRFRHLHSVNILDIVVSKPPAGGVIPVMSIYCKLDILENVYEKEDIFDKFHPLIFSFLMLFTYENKLANVIELAVDAHPTRQLERSRTPSLF